MAIGIEVCCRVSNKLVLLLIVFLGWIKLFLFYFIVDFVYHLQDFLPSVGIFSLNRVQSFWKRLQQMFLVLHSLFFQIGLII